MQPRGGSGTCLSCLPAISHTNKAAKLHLQRKCQRAGWGGEQSGEGRRMVVEENVLSAVPQQHTNMDSKRQAPIPETCYWVQGTHDKYCQRQQGKAIFTPTLRTVFRGCLSSPSVVSWRAQGDISETTCVVGSNRSFQLPLPNSLATSLHNLRSKKDCFILDISSFGQFMQHLVQFFYQVDVTKRNDH